MSQSELSVAILVQLRVYLCGRRPTGLWDESTKGDGEDKNSTVEKKRGGAKKGKGKQQESEKGKEKKGKGKGKEKKKGKAEDASSTVAVSVDAEPVPMDVTDPQDHRDESELTSRGARFGFEALATHMGPALFKLLPWVWEAITTPLETACKFPSSEHGSVPSLPPHKTSPNPSLLFNFRFLHSSSGTGWFAVASYHHTRSPSRLAFKGELE